MRATMFAPWWRRGWDSNPRTPVKMLLEFQSSAFDRSATSPINNLRKLQRTGACGPCPSKKGRRMIMHGVLSRIRSRRGHGA